MKYKIILSANNTEYQSEGVSMLEALRNIPLTYIQLKTKGTLFITKGKLKLEMFYNLKMLRRLLAMKVVKDLRAIEFDKLLR